ncbi:hypothetical protein C8F04DRAFT_1387838 [Mycena alexandri]|uniref:Uncharacterized protein n=1 Tax=Mycena alexandri TaxID=1745969 RepID=A0AAD6XIG0_9AGAR|nr:hypothetical protein C8F04DRAFT_1387838 [Mycena alexandri]
MTTKSTLILRFRFAEPAMSTSNNRRWASPSPSPISSPSQSRVATRGLGPTSRNRTKHPFWLKADKAKQSGKTRFQTKGNHVEKVAPPQTLPELYLNKLSTHIQTDSRDKKRKAAETSEDDDPNKRVRSESPERPLPPIITKPSVPDTTPTPTATPGLTANLHFNKMPSADSSSESTAGMRTTAGVIQMTNGQQYTAPPAAGFPRSQCVESPLRNTTDSNRAHWGAEKGPKGFIRVYRAKYVANARDVVSKLAYAIPKLVDAPSVIISPPTAREELDERLPAPWNFLLSSIPADSLKKLIDQGWWSTPTITFYVFDYNVPLPRYIMTLQNLCTDADPEACKFVARVVADKLKSLKEASDFLTKHSSTSDPKAAEDALNSIDAKPLEIALPGGETDLVWNIYFTPPPSIDFFRLLEWCTAARGLTYDTARHGTGVPRTGRDQLFCMGCKGYDHPTGLCPLPRIVGWFGAALNSVSAEDKTLSKADERNERKDKKSKGGNGKGPRTGGNGRRVNRNSRHRN